MNINNIFIALAAACLIVAALFNLEGAAAGVVVTRTTLAATPLTVYRPRSGPKGPAILIAHGFAGSQQLMQSFALTLARNGYVAITFDFPGHGRNPTPLTGSITDPDGATRTLVGAMQLLIDFARKAGDGRIATLGHSMASDIVVRVAEANADVAATIAVSMFSPAVTATSPRNLLVIVGEWEPGLKRAALAAAGLASAPAIPEPGVTYGDPSQGTGRRASFSGHVEHVGVLYSRDSLREAVGWLDRTFAIERPQPPLLDTRGPWIFVLIAGVVLLARPLSTLLPRITTPPAGANRRWRSLSVPLLTPMVVTPLLLRILPTHFLPILVGDYLAVHFATYGALTVVCLQWPRRLQWLRRLQRPRRAEPADAAPRRSWTSIGGPAACVIAYGFVALAWPLDRYVTSFVPGGQRLALVLIMLVGTLAYFLSDEWLTRGANAARGAYFASKCAFIVSLAIAVALDLERLFFLIIIIPVIGLFFLVYGLFSKWLYAQTGHPWVAACANAVAFAWAIGVTFPLLTG